jgi:hypothetical protein
LSLKRNLAQIVGNRRFSAIESPSFVVMLEGLQADFDRGVTQRA